MRIARIVIAGMCAAAVAAACAKTSTGSGSNSNWFSVCTSNADCGESLECWCGVCTKPCTTTSDCSDVKGANCDAQSGYTICGTPPKKLGCVVACENDGDCRAVAPSARCSGGACLVGATNSDGGGGICKSTPDEASARLGELFQNADHACARDSECFGGTGISCGSPCGFPYVSSAGWASIESEVAKLERNYCDPFFAAGCQEPVYFGCNFGDPICVRGTCENSGGLLGNGRAPDGGLLGCEEQVRELGQRMDAHARAADRSCVKDADCMYGTLDNGCVHGCFSGPLSIAGASALAAEVAAVGTDFCPAFGAAGCKTDVPSCPPPPPLKCVANICDYGVLP